MNAVLSDLRAAGVLMHVSSLAGSPGIGDIAGASQQFLKLLESMRMQVWQMLPIGPTGYGDSPYQSLSTFAGYEMLIGLDPLLREGWLEAAELDELDALSSSHVDYERLLPLKSNLLARAADRFIETVPTSLAAEFDAFTAHHDEAWLDDYALFRVIRDEQQGLPWWQWPPALAKRKPAALARVRKQSAITLKHCKVQQFWFEQQWQALRSRSRELGIRLFGDLPIYIAMDSADAWSRRDLLQLDRHGQPARVAGVPPDYFSEDGQFWGNPLYDWGRHEEQGFAWWIQRIELALQRFDLLRVDHFRGFESYWSVPANHPDARQGRWEPGPGDALFEALERALGRLPLVAENLGEITPEVESLRKRHGLPGMIILQFEVDNPDFKPETMDENNVIYTGTHDNDTTRGWYDGNDNENRKQSEIRATRKRARRLTGGTARTITRDLVRFALESRARLAVIPLQDYLGLGSQARMNTPGSHGGNWQWRVDASKLSMEFSGSVAKLVKAAWRDPKHAVQSGTGRGSPT